MIRLRPDCLVFKDPDGTGTPCSVHEFTLELVGPSAPFVDREMIEHAAEAVLHYFKVELGQTMVAVGDFAANLERVLRGLGLDLQVCTAKDPGLPPNQKPNCASINGAGGGTKAASPRPILEADLQELAGVDGHGCELLFFPRLRTEVRSRLKGEPVILRFSGLRGCAKRLAGTKRWTTHCQAVHDQIVEFLRTCLISEPNREGCALVVE